jgi:low affinity Fe/Cu permease
MKKVFTRFANGVAHAAGKPMTFALCCLAIVLWGSSGPLFGFSDTWQLIINTSTTIITFLMVFLIQNTQNRDGAAIQAKLDELIRSSAAKNVFIGIEHLPEEEVEKFRQRCEEAAQKSGEKLLRRASRKAADAADRATGSKR